MEILSPPDESLLKSIIVMVPMKYGHAINELMQESNIKDLNQMKSVSRFINRI